MTGDFLSRVGGRKLSRVPLFTPEVLVSTMEHYLCKMQTYAKAHIKFKRGP